MDCIVSETVNGSREGYLDLSAYGLGTSGENAYLSIPTDYFMDELDNEMTVEMRIRNKAAGSNWAFFAAPDDSAVRNPENIGYEKYLGVLLNNGITVERYANEGKRAPSINVFPWGYDDWHTIRIVFAEKSTRLYIDGNMYGEEASGYSLKDCITKDGNHSKTVFCFGHAFWNEGEGFNGCIDDIRIWIGAKDENDPKHGIYDPYIDPSVEEQYIITDHVVDPPETTVNMFDYWITGQTDNDYRPNHATGIGAYIMPKGINAGHRFLFIGYDASKYTYPTLPLEPQIPGGSPDLGLYIDGIYHVGSWNVSGHNTGIVENRLYDGYPKLSGNAESFGNFPAGTPPESMTESLAYLFDPNTDAIDKETDDPLYQAGKASYPDVTGLFCLDGAGYFYFDADKSFAELNIQDGDAPKQNHYIQSGDASTQADSDDCSSGNHITLYNKPWVALGVNSGIASKGQFFPFNDWSDLFHLDADGQPVQNHDYFYYQNLPGREQMNHYFGMTIETEFTQPINGKIHHGTDDMTFEFSGDDDVWIFIDDVLVCDIGGMHTAIKAEINFATGIVTVGDKEPTTLLDIFRNTADFDAKNFSGSSFAGGTSHTLKFFYLERGNNISNASIRFNFQDIQPDVISKVDENGNPMGNVKFELYPANLKAGKNPNICASYEKTRSDPIITITTRDDGSAEFLDEKGKPVDFSKYPYYILQESTPEGYRSNKDIILRFDKKDDTTGTGTNTFTVVNKYETGAYASFSTYFVQLGDVVQLAVRDRDGNIVMDTANRIPDGESETDYDEDKIREREEDLQEGLTFILPTVKDGKYGWLPLYGSNAEGWKKLDPAEAGFDNLDDSDDYMLALLTAAFYQLADEGAADLFMRWDRETGNLIANLEDLPGNATLYTGNEGTKLSQATLFVPKSVLEVIGLYPEEDTSYPDDYALLEALKEKLAHKASAAAVSDTAADYLMEAKAALQAIKNNYSALKSKESSSGTISTLKLLYTDKFERTYRSIIHIINQHQKLIVRKVDEKGEPLSGAVFGLYDTAEKAAKGGTDYLISGKTDNSGLLILNFSDIKTEVSDGQYWLGEITAPSGYQSNSELIQIIVDNSLIFVNASAYSYDKETRELKKIDDEAGANDHVKVYTAVGSLAHNVVRFTHTVIFDDFKLDKITGEIYTASASSDGRYTEPPTWEKDNNPFNLYFNGNIEYSMLDYAKVNNYNPDKYKVTDTDTEQEAKEKIQQKLDDLGVIVTDKGFAYVKPVLAADLDLSSMFSMLNIVEVTNVSNGEPVKKEISPGEDKPVMPGQHITYDIKWEHCYSEDKNPATITFTDELDPNLDFVSASYGDVVELKAEYGENGKIKDGSASGNVENTDKTVTIEYHDDGKKRTVIWTITKVPYEQEETVRLTVKVSDRVKDVDSSNGVYVRNHAVVYNSHEPNKPHKTEKVENPVAYFSIQKKQSVNGGLITTDPLSVRAGDKVTYYLYVSVKGNPGTKLDGVVVQDTVPEGLTLDTNSEITSQKSDTRISTFNKDPVTIEWRLGSVPVGDDPIILSYTVTVPPVTESKSWRNTAYAISGIDDNTGVLCPDREIPDDEEPSSWTPSNTVVIEEQVGKLQISKLIQKQGDDFLLAINEQAEFKFTVVLYDGSPNNPLAGTYGYSYLDENGNKCDQDGKPVNENKYTVRSGDTVTLKHGQSILIEGLPAGITYLVTEKDSKANGYNAADEEGIDKTATGVIVNGKAGQISQAKFVNIYSPDGKLRLTVNKEIVGRDWINGIDEFTFELTLDPTENYTKSAITAGKITMPIPDSNGNYTVTVKTQQEAYAVIDAIKFNDVNATDTNNKPKPYKFIVKETKPVGASGEVIGGDTVYNHLVYDEKEYAVYVTVTEPAQKNGELQVYAYYTVSDNTVTSASDTESGKYNIAMTFANTYKPTPAETDLSLEVIKKLTGRDWTNTDEFKFDLKLTGYYSYVVQEDNTVQEVYTPLTDSANTAEYITLNGSSALLIGKNSQWVDDASFKGYISSHITFKKVGKFKFSVTEDATDPIKGISYSDRKYVITVKVEDNDGTLTVTDVTTNISGSSGENHKVPLDDNKIYSTTLSFTNTYSAVADVNVPIKKVLEGWGNEQFKFTVTPVPTETLTNEEISRHVTITPDNITLSAGNDSGFFALKFTSNGSDTSSYSFIIAEEKNSEYNNIIFAEPYKMTVDLKDNNKDGTLSYTVSFFDKDGNPLEVDGPLTFVNEYSSDPPAPPQKDPDPPAPPQKAPDPPQNEPSPEPPTGDNGFNLDDDGIPRGDENLRDPDGFDLGDDGLPKGDLNLPTGVPFGSSAYFAVGTLLLVAAAVTVGKLFHSRKNK